MQEAPTDMPDNIGQTQSARRTSTRTEPEQLNIISAQTANMLLSGQPAHQKRSRQRRLVVVLGFLASAAVSVGGFFFYQTVILDKPKTANAQVAGLAPVVTVTTVAASIRPLEDILSVTGSVSSWDELKIGVETGGLRISSVNVEEGDLVKKGQVLAKLNSTLLEAQLAQAKAKLESSEATLVKSVQPNRPEDIAMLKAALAQAEDSARQEEAHKHQSRVTLENAELNADRYKLLESMGAISDADLETRQMTRENAALELVSADHKVEAAHRAVEQAKQRLQLACKGGRTEDITISRAGVSEIKAQVKLLSEQIKQTFICAPDDGMILKRDAHLGDTSEPGKAFFTMSRLSRLELKAEVNDSDLTKFKPGQTVSISTSETGSSPVTGKVRLVGPQVDPSSRLGTVHIDLPENCPLKPGMFVRGETHLSSYSALTVPVDCLVSRGGESFVFTLSGNRAVCTPVSTGVQTDHFIEIKRGLAAGQLVIEKGARFLSDRDVVDLAK